MKTKLALEEPKRPVYSNFKSFNNNYFEEELSSKLDLNNKDYAVLEDNFVNVLNKHAPKKTNIFRDNHKPHISKTLRLAIMKRSRLTEFINEVLRNSKSLELLKLSEIVPVYKKKDPTDKSNFRPISILPLISNVFEKVIFDQLCNYMNKFLNNLLCGFRKVRSTHHVLFRLLKARQKEVDQCGFIGTRLIDLSNAFDCLPHDLLIAKLEAYGLDTASLSLLKNYLTNWKQRT